MWRECAAGRQNLANRTGIFGIHGNRAGIGLRVEVRYPFLSGFGIRQIGFVEDF